jgi:hypothetical protein|tara:strand:+ start:100 stop:315 length:216 start_codon:yes stop_codon:yes gene_type:complete
MLETVVALLMFLNGDMIEFTYKESMSECLKSRRIAMREINPDTVLMSCKKISAETEIYQGRKKILKVIESD